MKGRGEWSGWLARFYYFTGSVYYAYHWFLVIGGAGFLLSAVFACFQAPILVAILLVVAVSSSVLGISFARRVAKIRYNSLNPSLRIERLRIDYHFTSEKSSEYVREVHAQALLPIDNYRAKFLWSGQGGVECSPIRGAARTDHSEETGSFYNVCRVDFGEQLPKGKGHTFIYKQRFFDATKPVRPFLGHTLDCRPKELTLRVHLLPTQDVRSYRRQIFTSVMSSLYLWQEVVVVSDPQSKQLEWTIPNPTHNLYYRIIW